MYAYNDRLWRETIQPFLLKDFALLNDKTCMDSLIAVKLDDFL